MRILRHATGFTLIELLITISIVVFLTGMMMPLLTLAKRSALKTVTMSTMAKTEAAVYQFKTDFKGYPYYQMTNLVDGAAWSNSLNYNIGTDISTAEQAAVKADMQTASGDYGYSILGGPSIGASSTQTFVESDLAANGWTWSSGSLVFTYPAGPFANCMLLNRLGSERANEMMLIGEVPGYGVKMLTQTCTATSAGVTQTITRVGRDLSSTPLVSSPQSINAPGWAKDYLQGEVDAKYLQGNVILDAYLNPLIYICQVTPGVEYTWGDIYNTYVDISNPSGYGLAPVGRQTLESYVPGTSTPITGDPATLPDPTNLMHSDMRYWAAPGLELEFELWSAGPDGKMSYWRDDPSNRDNISCEPYNSKIGIPP